MKRIASIAVVLFVLTFSVNAQSAKVVPLSPQDSEEAKSLEEQMKVLVAKTEAFRKSVMEKYLVTPDRNKGGQEYHSSFDGLITYGSATLSSTCYLSINGNANVGSSCPESKPTPEQKAKEEKERKEYEAKRRWIRAGWGDGGYVYSDDYKFIVPKPSEFNNTRPNSSIWGNCVTPAVGVFTSGTNAKLENK